MTAVPQVLARWGIPPAAELTRTDRGTNNQTLAVRLGPERWILRISQNLSAGQVRAEHRLLARLHGAGLPFAVPEPVPTLAGDTVTDTPAGPATLCRWLPGVPPELASEPSLERFGHAIGLLSVALRDVPRADCPHDWRRGDPLPPDQDMPGAAALARELRAAGAERAAVLETAADRVTAYWPAASGELPVQVVHGDLAASNILVDERAGQVTAVLDFELAGADFRVQDLVVALLLSGALAGPDWPRRAAALVRGHAAVLGLSPQEIQAIPALLIGRCVGSVQWRAGRWQRGHAQLAEVIDRLEILAVRMNWLATSGDQLLELISAGQAARERSPAARTPRPGRSDAGPRP